MSNLRRTQPSWTLIVIAVTTATGCGTASSGGGGSGGTGAGNASGGTGGTGGDFPDGLFCPESYAAGSACDNPGDACVLEADECGGGLYLTCGDDNLLAEIETAKCCSGGEGALPYPVCPELAPTAGDACEVCIGAEPCTYPVDIGCGAQEVQAECNDQTSTWEVVEPLCE